MLTVSTVTPANVSQDTLEIIVKLVRHLIFSFQSEFVYPEVTNLYFSQLRFNCLSFFRFLKILTTVLIARVITADHV